MTGAPIAEAVPGHNSGADAQTLEALMAGLPTVDQLIELLMAENQEALDRVAAIQKKGGEYFMIDSDEADAAATEFLVKVRARYKASEADRVGRKSPFDDLAGAVQAFYKTRILDPLGAAPSNAREEFDPTDSDQYGVGVRITMAQTLFKRRKAETERQAREAEARRIREEEDRARRVREEAERVRRAEENRLRLEREAAEQARRAEEERQRQEHERAAADERERVRQAEAAASRKRTEASQAAATAELERQRQAAEEAERVRRAEENRLRLEREERERQERARQEEEDRAREERERVAREEENRLAEARARAEESAAATTADLSRARGGKGGVSSLREFVDFRDLNRNKLAECNVPGAPRWPSILELLPFITDAAIEKAVKDYEKANKATVLAGIKSGKQPIYGVVYFLNSKAAGRA